MSEWRDKPVLLPERFNKFSLSIGFSYSTGTGLRIFPAIMEWLAKSTLPQICGLC